MCNSAAHCSELAGVVRALNPGGEMPISLGYAGAGAADQSAPGEAEIRAQLARILGTPDFQSSPKRGALLRYLVEESLQGRGDLLKGFTVAVAVFGRDASFDPQNDPVVRLAARRLRIALDCYYGTAGACDPLRISIPKGHYRPLFDQRNDLSADPPGPVTPERDSEYVGVQHGEAEGGPGLAATPLERPLRNIWRTAGLLVGCAVAAAVVWFWSIREPAPTSARGPAIVVLPFEVLGAYPDDRFLASGMTQELITDLMRFPDLRLYSVPASFRQDAKADPVEVGRDLGVAYVVSGNIGSNASVVRVGVQLADAQTGRVLWSETYDRDLTPAALLAVRGELAADIATVLGQPYGVIHSDMTDRLAQSAIPSMPSYDCVLQAFAYRRSFLSELYAPTLACLEAAVQRDPDFADAWAMLGWLHLDGARFGWAPDGDTARAFDQALSAASKAVSVDSNSVLGLQALGSIYHYTGNFQKSVRFQRQALALNPNDPDTLAQLGWRLAVRGDWDEGIPYLQRAIDRTLSPPGWYYHLIAIHDYVQGDYEDMLSTAERSAVDGSGISWSLIAIANGALGNQAAAREALARMAEVSPDLARNPAAAYRKHQPVEPIVEALVAGLRKAGWTEPDPPAAAVVVQ
jgi:TolB-like protein